MEYTDGASAFEVFAVVIPMLLFTFLTLILEHHVLSKTYFVFEFAILVFPVVLLFTIMSEYCVLLGVLVLLTLMSILGVLPPPACPKSVPHSGFITNARSTINLLSVIAILAVDFSVFPRHFSKTLLKGYSLMDLGTGLFLYSNGVVHKNRPFNEVFKGCIPIAFLGFARIFCVTLLDYPVGEEEYGKHWNFFLTLAATKLFACLIASVMGATNVIWNAVLLLMAHEIFLQVGLERLVSLDTPRDTLFLANKEGIVSLLGYVGIYLLAVHFGSMLKLQRDPLAGFQLSGKALCSPFVYLGVSQVLSNYFGVSRRLANAAYGFWIMFIGSSMTCLFYCMQNWQLMLFGSQFNTTPFLFEAINYNGLLFFLLANLLTGLINVSVSTEMIVNSLVSVIILITYMFVNCLVVWMLKRKNCKFKF